jgi:hypothetical protein
MMLVRIVAPDFVAGFETDGTVRRAAPIISYMLGWPNAKVREHVKAKGWSTSIIVSGWPRPGERWGLTPEERQKAFDSLNDPNRSQRPVTPAAEAPFLAEEQGADDKPQFVLPFRTGTDKP